MKARCKYPSQPGHKYYLALGIKVCPAWENSFETFLRDIGPAPSPAHTIDRWPDPAGNYEPNNVRWATRREQRENRRPGAKVRGWKRKAVVITPETRAKISASLKGRKSINTRPGYRHTAKTKANISAAIKAHWIIRRRLEAILGDD